MVHLDPQKKTEHLVEDWCVLDHQRGKSEMKGYYMERRESAKWLLGKRYTKKQYEAAAQHLRKKNSIHSHTLLHKNGTHTSILSCSWLMHISTHTQRWVLTNKAKKFNNFYTWVQVCVCVEEQQLFLPVSFLPMTRKNRQFENDARPIDAQARQVLQDLQNIKQYHLKVFMYLSNIHSCGRWIKNIRDCAPSVKMRKIWHLLGAVLALLRQQPGAWGQDLLRRTYDSSSNYYDR